MRVEKIRCPQCLRKSAPYLQHDPERKCYWRRCSFCDARVSRNPVKDECTENLFQSLQSNESTSQSTDEIGKAQTAQTATKSASQSDEMCF